MIAFGQRTGILVHILGFALADLFDALVDILVSDLRLSIRNLDAPIVVHFELGSDFEFGLEPQRLPVMEVNVGDIRGPDHIPVLFVRFLAECLRQNVLEHILADRVLESVLMMLTGALPGRKPGR